MSAFKLVLTVPFESGTLPFAFPTVFPATFAESAAIVALSTVLPVVKPVTCPYVSTLTDLINLPEPASTLD